MNFLLVLTLTMNIIGSYFHIVSESYSVGFLLLTIATIYILSTWIKHGFIIPKSQFPFLLFCTIFFITSLFAVLFYRTDDNLRVLKFIINLSILFLFLTSLSINKRFDIVDKSIASSVLIILIILITQFFSGTNHATAQESFYAPIGPYYNPNDLSIVSLVILLYLIEFYQWKYKSMLIILSTIIIFVSASRLAMAAVIFLGIIHYSKLIQLLHIKKIIKVAIIVVIIYFLFQYMEEFKYSITRFNSIPNHFNINQSDRDSSFSLRVGSLLYFLENLNLVNSGSFQFRNYNYFFQNSTFANGLMAENPHNFFVEIILLYGKIGFSLAALLIIYILINLRRIFLFPKKIFSYFFILVCSFCISSSVINFLPLWIVVITILCHQPHRSFTSKLEQSTSESKLR